MYAHIGKLACCVHKLNGFEQYCIIRLMVLYLSGLGHSHTVTM